MQLPPQQSGMTGAPRPSFPAPPSQGGGPMAPPGGMLGQPMPGQPRPMGGPGMGPPAPLEGQMQGMNLGGQPPMSAGPSPGFGGAPLPPASAGGGMGVPRPMGMGGPASVPGAPPGAGPGFPSGPPGARPMMAPPPSIPGMGGPPKLGMLPPQGPPSMPGGMQPPSPSGMGMLPPGGQPGMPGMMPLPPGALGAPPMQHRPPGPPGPGMGPPQFANGNVPPPPGPGMGMNQGPGTGMAPPVPSGPSGPRSAGMGMGMQPSSPGSRIDPSQIPRPSNQPPSAPQEFETRVGGQNNIPPPASSRFFVRDRGNAGPRYMRSTLGQIPFSQDLLTQSAMPLSLVVSPLSLPHPNDDQIPVVDLGEMGPIRCGRCRAYINPFMRFSSTGRNFNCNFCGFSNPTPEAYLCHMGHDGRRRDADSRAELCCGSVEFVATPEYQIRPPMEPSHMFLIEVTSTALSTGVTASACAAIGRVLEDIPESEKVNVGIATFDGTIHFYSLRPGSSVPQMLVVPDTTEVYVPDSSPIVVGLAENKEGIKALLEQIPSMFTHNIAPSSCGVAAIEAGVAALQRTGGKLHAFLAMLPTVGIHALRLRDASGPNAKDKLLYLESQDNTMKTLAMSAADVQVSIDICFMAQGYCDLATFRDLTLTTGGTMYQYTPFNPMMDHDQVLNDLKWNLARPQGMEAVMRVRCSQGMEVSSYLGAFNRLVGNMTDIQLAAIDCDKSVVVGVRHLEKLAPGAEAYFQAALLYTTMDGQRRIRVHTLGIPISDNMSTIFKAADLDSQIATIGRRLAATLPASSLQGARDSITNQSVAILAAYRRYCAANSSAAQLILPEALKLLPLFALALLKGPGLKEDAKPDERALWLTHMMSLEACRITPLLYPRLMSCGELLYMDDMPEDIPDGLVLSAEKLTPGGIFLLENGFEAYLHIDKAVSPVLLNELMGVGSYEELCGLQNAVALLPRENKASQALQKLLVQVRVHRSSFLRLRVTRKSDPHELSFFNQLVEDRSSSGSSYVEYLCQVHRLIQSKI